MKRVLEPEVMGGDQAIAYAQAALDEANVVFCRQVLEAFPKIESGTTLRVLDVGSGPGDIGIWLAQRGAGLHVTLLDASPDMLAFAERRVAEAGLSRRFEIVCARVPEVETTAPFDLLISNTFLHHVPHPADFWAWAAPQVRPGGAFFVRDLRRPDSPEAVDALVQRYAADADPIHREDYRNSFFAALTPDEVTADLHAVGLTGLECRAFLDRYWVVQGRRS